MSEKASVPSQVHPSWAQGDFSLVSSDNVTFKVSSRTLCSISDVLGDAVEAGSDSMLIQFSDREIENSRVVNSFPLLATRDELTPVKSHQGAEFCSEMEALIRFMDKYGCRRVMAQFKFCLLGHLELSRIDPMTTFAIGSAAGDSYVCIKALEKAAQDASKRITCPSELTDAPFEVLQNACPLDPGVMPHYLAHFLQPNHAWALNRAWALSITRGLWARCTEHPERAVSKVVPKFTELIKGLEDCQKLSP